MKPSAFLTTLICGALAPAIGAQVGGAWEDPLRFDGIAPNDEYGTAVGAAGDVDADGVPDLIVGSPWESGVGAAYVYSGASGALLWHFVGTIASEQFGDAVAGAGDVDGDGHDDLLVGAPGNFSGTRGRAWVYSGASGTIIYALDGVTAAGEFGASVAGVGDLNGDGHDDFIVGADEDRGPGASWRSGVLHVFSGATGQRVARLWEPISILSFFGHSCAGIGDQNGDGTGDIVVGSPSTGVQPGSVYVYSGADGSLIRVHHGSPSDRFGWDVDDAGDTDGDGVADLIVGARGALTERGSAFVYSGATGALLRRFDGAPNSGGTVDRLGYSVAGVGDVDGDGLSDVASGAWTASHNGMTQSGSLYLWSGATGELLQRFDGSGQGDNLGFSSVGLGDLDGDGLGEILVGAPHDSGSGPSVPGHAQLLRFSPFLTLGVDEVSIAARAPIPVSLDFPSTEAGMRYAILASAAGPGPAWLGGIEVPLTLSPSLSFMLAGLAPTGVLDLDGDEQFVLRLHRRVGAGAIGRTLHVAAVSIDPVGVSGRLSSIARTLQILP